MRSRHQQREGEANRRLLWALGLAVLFHLAGLPLLTPLFPAHHGNRPEARPIRLVALSSHTAKIKPPKIRTRPEVKKTPQPEEKKKEEPVVIDRQIVDIPPSPDDTAPDEANYYSEHNTRTERETRSRFQAPVFDNVMNERTTAQKPELADPAPPSEEKSAIEIGPETTRRETEKKKGQQTNAFELPEVRRRDRLALKLDPELGRLKNQSRSDAVAGQGKRLKLAIGSDEEQEQPGTAPKQAPQIADLVPNLGVLARLSGAPANDHLEDLEEGDGTFLNSREFKYASFFNRMKRGVSQHWHPLNEYRRRDPSGNVYGYRSRVTVLNVTLQADGSLKNISVQRSSGIDFLDHEAISAFRRAEPFPNPPKGLIQDGFIQFPFGFHVDFTQRGGLRLPF